MNKQRMEAFSDAVIAIVVTIMVLELRPPHGTSLAALRPLTPVFLAYALSFVYLMIYWNNHHHMMQAAKRVNGAVLWANAGLMFSLSLIPFVTAWMGENPFAHGPLFLYGMVLLLSAAAFTILQMTLLSLEGPDSLLARAVGTDRKGRLSLVLYTSGILLGLLWAPLSWLAFAIVAVIWLVPDSRIERALAR